MRHPDQRFLRADVRFALMDKSRSSIERRYDTGATARHQRTLLVISRHLRNHLVVMWMLVILQQPVVWADGGRVETSQLLGQTRVTVLSSPTPLRAGEIEVSVLLQVEDNGTVLRNQEVKVSCMHEESKIEITRHATHDQSTNQLLHCARFTLPKPGAWMVTVHTGMRSNQAVKFTLNASRPLHMPSGLWMIALSPVGFVAVYMLRERIQCQRHQGKPRTTQLQHPVMNARSPELQPLSSSPGHPTHEINTDQTRLDCQD